MTRLKAKEIQAAKEILLVKQRYICPLCSTSLLGQPERDRCLDHCHVNGQLRGVLCRNCNGCEGRIFNLARRAKRTLSPEQWLRNLLAYLTKYQEEPTGIYHPTHRTDEEKRLRRNKKARERRAKKK